MRTRSDQVNDQASPTEVRFQGRTYNSCTEAFEELARSEAALDAPGDDELALDTRQADGGPVDTLGRTKAQRRAEDEERARNAKRGPVDAEGRTVEERAAVEADTQRRIAKGRKA